MDDRGGDKVHFPCGHSFKKFGDVFLRVQAGDKGGNNAVRHQWFEGGVAGDDDGFIFCLAEKLNIFIQRRTRSDNNSGKVSEFIFQGRNAGVSLDRALVGLEISFPKFVESEESCRLDLLNVAIFVHTDNVTKNKENGNRWPEKPQQKDGQREHGHGIGLSNVGERLKVIYGDQCKLELKSEADRGTIARVEIPDIDISYLRAS